MSKIRKDNIHAISEHQSFRNKSITEAHFKLLKKSRDILVNQFLKSVIQMMDKVDDTLFDLADKAENNQIQTTYFDAMREVRLKRDQIESTFKDNYLDAFELSIKTNNTLVENPESTISDDLAILDDEQVEEGLAIDTMTTKIKNMCLEELYALDKRAQWMLCSADQEDFLNPLDPSLICESFRDACEAIETGIKIKLIILKLFDKYVCKDSRIIYREINIMLAKADILPNIRRDIKKDETYASTILGSADPAETDDQVSIPGDVVATIQEVLNNQKNATSGNTPQLMQTLTYLQKGHIDEINPGSIQQIDTMIAQTGSANFIRKLKDCTVTNDSDAAQIKTIDIIAMLFDYVFEDKHIPSAMKALIGRLQIPILKVALLDKSFFSKKSHPARAFLNRLSDAVSNYDRNDNCYDSFAIKVNDLVQRILNNFEENINVFEPMLEELEHVLRSESRSTEKKALVSTKISQGKEKIAQGKVVVKSHIEAEIAKKPVRSIVKSFLIDQWSQLLVTAYFHEGDKSDSWKNGTKTVSDLIWSVQPKTTSDDRRALVKLLPGLLTRLHSGMEIISMDMSDRRTFLTQLAVCHGHAVNANSTAARTAIKKEQAAHDSSAPPAVQSLNSDETPTWEINKECVSEVLDTNDKDKRSQVIDEPGIEVEEIVLRDDQIYAETNIQKDEHDDLVDSLEKGQWIDFTNEKNESTRLRLTWVSSATGIHLFTNRRGVKVAEKSRQQLAVEFRRQTAKIVDDVPLIDRAIGNLLDGYEEENVG